MKNKIIKSLSLLLMFLLFSQTNLMARISDDIYHLVSGVEYMDKTFIYQIENQRTEESYLTMCAQKNAPTYDVKKGLMTWVDYYSYQLEEIFETEKAAHIRAILEVAGPHLNKDEVVNYLEERTMLVGLTYNEVVSAMQYAIWYYTDNDERVPSTSVGKDLFSYLLTLPKVYSQAGEHSLNLVIDGIYRNSNEGNINIQFHYNFEDNLLLDENNTIAHSYSKDLVAVYGASEVITTVNNQRNVSLLIPITDNNMSINFDITVDGYLEEEGDVCVFLPREDEIAQRMVGYVSNVLNNPVDSVQRTVNYEAFQLTLLNKEIYNRRGFSSGRFVPSAEINGISPTSLDDLFLGWFDEDGNKVVDGITMNKDRYLVAVYEEEVEDNKVPGDLPDPDDGNDPSDDPDDGNGDDPSDDPDDGNGNDPNDDPDNGNGDNPTKDPDDGNGNDPSDDPDDGNGDNPSIEPDDDKGGNLEEEIFDDEPTPEEIEIIDEGSPFDGWFPNTGGIPFLIFMVVGLLLVVVGYLFTKRKYNKDESK